MVHTARDIVDFAIDGQASKVKDVAQQIIASKVADALDVRRTEIARNLLVQPDTDDVEDMDTNDTD